MKIGIDISQLAYERTGVANYLRCLVEHLLEVDTENEYILFFSSMRNNFQFPNVNFQSKPNVSIKRFKFPPTLLNILWNKLHVMPIEILIGDVDVFITSDWTEPPVKKAKKMTILYDLIIYKCPQETAAQIIATQKKKLEWVKKESAMILCVSEATKRDAEDILGIEKDRLAVVYPGV
ncbi:MAG: glycosyltransferase [Candidatus Levyibacteriota bacterium]